MSQENVDLMRRGTELWLSGDFKGWLKLIDPDIGWDISAHPLPDVPNRGRGRDALVKDVLLTYMLGWTEYSVEIKEVFGAGEQVIVVVHETMGVPLERDVVHLWTVREGRAVFVRVFRTKAEALEAAGLSE